MPQPSSELIALVIEDDPDLVHIFARALEIAGYQTHMTGDGEEAVTLLTNIVPDIVVLDLHLPGVPGQKILQIIRADGRFQNTRVILATADYQTAEDLRKDADLVLLKPISFKQLRDLSARLRSAQH
ncbi:MAG: response regulator [Anaerolineaceae bacterium]|nr:response regulator [Anaerolineaceae bacterium]